MGEVKAGVLASASSTDNCECGKKRWPPLHCERCQQSFAALWPSEKNKQWRETLSMDLYSQP